MATPSNAIMIRIADANGYIAMTDAYVKVDPSITIGALLGAVGTLLARVQNCSDGRIVEAQMSLGVDVSAYAAKTIPNGTVTLENLGLAFTNTGDSSPWDFLVPAVALAVFPGTTPDMSEGATIDILADTLENVTPLMAGLTFVTSRGGALGPTASGFRSVRKRGKYFGRQTLSVES